MVNGMYRQLHWMVVALALCLPVGTLSAADPPQPPTSLPVAVTNALPGQALHMLGHGRMRKWFWDAFDASLWITGENWNWNQPFVLELRYIRSFEGSEIVEGTRNQWEHLGLVNDIRLRGWLTQLTGIFPDVKAGDQLAGVYQPGGETHFFHNGQPIGTMMDPEFGPTFFAIWLDEKTSQPALRTSLLGGLCTKSTVVAQSEENHCRGATMPAPSSQQRPAQVAPGRPS